MAATRPMYEFYLLKPMQSKVKVLLSFEIEGEGTNDVWLVKAPVYECTVAGECTCIEPCEGSAKIKEADWSGLVPLLITLLVLAIIGTIIALLMWQFAKVKAWIEEKCGCKS